MTTHSKIKKIGVKRGTALIFTNVHKSNKQNDEMHDTS